jgi:hypothetical protein
MVAVSGGPADKPISGQNKPTGRGGQGFGMYNATRKQKTQFAQKQRPSVTSRPTGALGSADVLERRLKAASQGKALSGRSQGAIQSNAVEEDPYAWLRELMGGGGGGGGGAVRSFSDAQIASTQARLQAIYDRYAQDILDREAAIGTTYDTAGTNLGSAYDTSVGNINSAYDAARAAQTQQLLALGMTEQTPVQQFGNQTAATTSLQNLRAAVLAQNEASRKAAITNQRLASEAAKREGADRVAQTVAEMQSAMTPVSGGGGGGGGISPYQYASLVMRQQENDMSAQQAAARLAQPQAPVVDRQAILNQVAGNNAGLSTEQYNLARFLAG